jgi:signal transduction histidine kinase
MSEGMNRRTPSVRRPRATGRWRFLADASATLDTSIDYAQTLANTVRLAVPEVADYCVVVLVGDDGSVRWADSAHRDPSKRALLEGLRGYVRPIGSPEHPVETALRTGEPQLMADAGGQLLKWGDGTSLSLVRGLAPTSYIAVPMAARGHTFGAILFAVTAESGRRYGLRDLELATDVGRRAGFAIDHALLYRAAESAARAREELMAVVAHDLKNPLNTVQLAVRVLLDDNPIPDDAAHKLERHALAAIQRAADRMYRLIHDLLELARADAGRLWIQPAPAAPEELLREAIDAHCSIAAAKSITLEATTDGSLPNVLADRERIAQVFSNLIGNALKFTPSGGRVSIRGSRATPGVRFAVEDTGPGMLPHDQAHVFDRFWQAAKASGLGTGLGLSIAKAIVEGHGGTISVESTPGVGSVFEFSLPANQEAGMHAEPPPGVAGEDRHWVSSCQPPAVPPQGMEDGRK